MARMNIIGKEHNEHLNWLLNSWTDSGHSPICFLEGFPGTGKTFIAEELIDRAKEKNLPALMITVPDTSDPDTPQDPTNVILLDLAHELTSIGRNDLAQAIENNRGLDEVLSNLLAEPIIIIIDEFQYTMLGRKAQTTGGFAAVLSKLTRRQNLKGRVLLLTNRYIERARWSSSYEIKRLKRMSQSQKPCCRRMRTQANWTNPRKLTL